MEAKGEVGVQSASGESSTGQFFKMPWFDGPEHGVSWPRLPRANGQKQSPFGTESSMRADNLSVPSSTVFLSPLEVELKSDEEYQTLIEQNFDDIASTNTGGVDYAKSWYERRVQLETGFFSGKACSLQVRQRYQEDGTGGEDRFQVRTVGETFAVATRVVNTLEVDEMYARIAEDAQKHEFRSMAGQVTARIEGATSVDDCESIIVLLGKLLEKYIADRQLAREREARAWMVMCTARRDVLLQEKEEEEPKGEGEGEEEEDKDEDGDEKRANEERKKAEEKAKAVESRATIVIGVTTAVYSKRQDVGRLFLTDRNVLVPDVHPTYVPAKEYELVDEKEKSDKKEKEVSLADLLTKARKEEGKETGDDEKETKDEGAAAAAVERREITRFDRITDERIKSTLYGINLTPGCSSGKWRDLKTPILVPCAVSSHDKTVLVVDHDKARVLIMPTGQETGEEYKLTDENGKVIFKVVGCSINGSWILILGYRLGQNMPTLLTISRHMQGGKMTRMTAFSTSIPMVSAILSETPTQPDEKGMVHSSMLVGFVDGTLLRLPVQPIIELSSAIIMIAPTRIKHARLIEQGERRRAQKKYGAAVYVPPFNGDEVLWSGHPVPLTRIVEHGRRIVASSPIGLHVFKLNIPEFLELPNPDNESGEKIKKPSERIAHLALEHNSSFDFRGNILAILKVNNCIELVNLHTYKLDACIGAPSGLNPAPPDLHIECSNISIHDQRILFMHADGSYRSLDLNDYNIYTAPLAKSRQLNSEDRAASFLTANGDKKKTAAGKKIKKKAGKKSKKKNNKAKKGK